jgi:hypothetical protein
MELRPIAGFVVFALHRLTGAGGSIFMDLPSTRKFD